MPKYVVLFDAANYMRLNELLPNRVEHVTLRKGDDVPSDVPEAEVTRLLGIGAIGTTTQAQAQETAAAAGGGAPLASDEDLAGYNVEQTIAYVGQHPDELDRVLEAENARSTPRKGVLALADAGNE